MRAIHKAHYRKDSPTGGLNAGLLSGVVGLMVLGHVLGNDGAVFLHPHDQPRVADVRALPKNNVEHVDIHEDGSMKPRV